MNESFEQVANLEELDDAFTRSNVEPVVLFNHDPWCPISARAHRVMSSLPRQVNVIDVSRQRDVTSEIARRTGVRHESPQVLVLRNGKARWSASHSAISIERVMGALDAARPATGGSAETSSDV